MSGHQAEAGMGAGIVVALAGVPDARCIHEVRKWAIEIAERLLLTDRVAFFEFAPNSFYLRCVAHGRGLSSRMPFPELDRITRVVLDGAPDFAGRQQERHQLGLQASVPVRTEANILGALAIYGGPRSRVMAPEQRHTMLAIGRQAGLALDRVGRTLRLSPPGGSLVHR